ncbi:MAG: dNTP triphosphohydrolase [Deltaproteobacteria bacterium]|nr:dNTP triphosphohydrolase [Deltaproteobacteria bacterium]
MLNCGGFEGNGQTLRIVMRLEKYKRRMGMNPTRRLVLALLKYPVPYSAFDGEQVRVKPPKCYFDTEKKIVNWAFGRPFTRGEVAHFTSRDVDDEKPSRRTLDSSLMEIADDIAYGVHDLEDIVARDMVDKGDVLDGLRPVFRDCSTTIGPGDKAVSLREFDKCLFADSFERKQFIGKLVNLFVTTSEIKERCVVSHPLLKYYIGFEPLVGALLKALKDLTYRLVIDRAEVQQLERRGQHVVNKLFEELVAAPDRLIPRNAREALDEDDPVERRVCDYIAGMTDRYAEKIYKRLFIPGEGSSHDEL